MIRACVIAIVVLLTAAPAWTQFYAGLGEEARRELAESYYLAGVRYRDVGEREKGQRFIDSAFVIYRGLDPATIREDELPSLEELLSRGPISFLGTDTRSATEELIKSRFLRIAGALLTEDVRGVVGGLAGSIMLTPGNVEVTQQQAAAALDQLFSQTRLTGTPLSEVYDLSSLRIRQSTATLPLLGPTFELSIDAKADLSRYVSFWRSRQTFYISRSATNEWLVTAIGPSAPPGNWSPQVPLPASSLVRTDMAATRRVIRSAFLSMIGAFLDKDAEGAVRHLADQVVITRRDLVLDRDDIAAAANQYFESTPYWGLMAREVVDVAGIEIGSRGEGVFVLQAEFTDVAKQGIPEWTVFREFFFSLESSVWRVFAIS